MIPITIDSKAATNDLLRIKSLHADLLTGIENQAQKVAQYNQQKIMEQQANDALMREDKINTQKSQMDTQKMQMEMETKKLVEQNKAKELEIKQQALTLP